MPRRAPPALRPANEPAVHDGDSQIVESRPAQAEIPRQCGLGVPIIIMEPAQADGHVQAEGK